MSRFEPLPLGANAFAPPVFTAPSVEEEPKRWRKAMPWFLLAGIAGASGLAVWIAMIVNQPASKDDADERAAATEKVEERAMLDQQPAEPAQDSIAEAEPTQPAQAEPLPAAAAVQEAAADQPAAAAATPAPAAEASAQADEEDAEKDDGRSPAERDAAREKRHAARAAKAAAGASKLPAAPSRADVLAAMARVHPAVVRCMDGAHGVVTADMKVLSTGRVASANVSGAPPKSGSCIAGALRKARFPEFSAASIAVRYPMKL